jgi:hypothetical protein
MNVWRVLVRKSEGKRQPHRSDIELNVIGWWGMNSFGLG